jgi:hypothetical protein
MTLEDALHYSEARRRAIVDGYPPMKWKPARRAYLPSVPDVCFLLPKSLSRRSPCRGPWVVAISVVWTSGGIIPLLPSKSPTTGTPTASTCLPPTAAGKPRRSSTPQRLRPWGGIPWAWPHDGMQHDKGSGKQLAEQYREQKLALLTDFARFEDGTYGLEAGVMSMLARMQTGRLKVARHLSEWFEEFRLYHRKDGIIVPERDDLLSATRYAIMSLRYAEAEASDASWSDAPAWGVA